MFTSRRFRDMHAGLPKDNQQRASWAFRLFRRNPAHPGLNFKKVEALGDVYSVRIGLGYRALGRVDGDVVV